MNNRKKRLLKNIEKLQLKNQLKMEKQTETIIFDLIKLYNRTSSEINKDIQHILEIYQGKNNLNDKIAINYLNNAQKHNKSKEVLLEYKNAKSEAQKARLKAIYNAYSTNYRVQRLQALKHDIRRHIIELGANEEQLNTAHYIKILNNDGINYKYIINNQAHDFFNKIDKRTINQLLAKKWYNGNYSSRIWKNKDLLMNELDTIFSTGILKGDSIPKIAKKINERMNVGKYNSVRLVRTESAYFHNQKTLLDYKESDIKEYQYIATLDKRTSSICREHDGKIYKVSEAKIGVNYPPLHVNCRSTTIPYFKEYNSDKETRIARDIETGKNYKTNAKDYKQYIEEQNAKHGQDTIVNEVLKDVSYKENNKDFSKTYINSLNTMLKRSNPNVHQVKELKKFIVDGKVYEVDNKHVKFNYNKEEKDIAKLLNSTFGGELYLLPEITKPSNIKMSDYFWDGERWDLKTLQKDTKGANAFSGAIKNIKNQSNNIIINIKSDYYNDMLKINEEIDRLFNNKRYKYLEKLIIVKNNKVSAFYIRA